MMSVIKRILEANRFSKTLPHEWEDKLYREALAKKVEELKAENLVTSGFMKLITTNRQSKKTDENQLSLF